MPYIWRLINVGFGIEATKGTAVAVDSRQPKTDFSFDETNEVIQDESSIGVPVDSRDSFVVRRFGEGEIAGNIETNAIGYLLKSVFWDVASAVDSSWAYIHDFTLNADNDTPSLTIGVDDPVEWDKSYSLGSIDSLTIGAEIGQQATFSADFMSKQAESATHTVSYSTDNKLLAHHSEFKTATNLAGLGAASAVCIESFEITFTKNLSEDYCLDSINPTDFLNQQFTIEGSFTAKYKNEDFKDYQLDGTQRAVRFELKDDQTTIGTSSNPTLTIDLPLASFTEFDRSMGNDEVVTQTINFKGLYSQADGEAVEVALVNTTDEY